MREAGRDQLPVREDSKTNDFDLALARLETAAMLSREAVACGDAQGHLVWWNRAFEKLVGLPREALLWASLVEILPLWREGARLPADAHPVTLALAGRPPLEARFEIARQGDRSSVDLVVAPTAVEDPELPGIVLILRRPVPQPAGEAARATRERRSEIDSLQARIEMLEAVLAEERAKFEESSLAGYRTKSAFLANMTHELRTPLSAIMGYADLLNRELLSQGHQSWSRDVAQIREAADRLFFMITQLLDMAAIEEGQFELKIGRFSVSRLVADVEITASAYMKDQKNRFTVRVDPMVGELVNDEGKLRKVLLHLLSNAAKFTVAGQIRLDVSAANGMVHFLVTDSGMGMTTDQVRRIFEPFTQVDESLTRRFEGGGVGLYICRSFLEMMGGTIEVSSAPGAGSIFSVAIPDRDPDATN